MSLSSEEIRYRANQSQLDREKFQKAQEEAEYNALKQQAKDWYTTTSMNTVNPNTVWATPFAGGGGSGGYGATPNTTNGNGGMGGAVYGNWSTGIYNQPYVVDEVDVDRGAITLEKEIKRCGKDFYYLVSPYTQTDGDGLWHAKGRRAVGKGTTALEAVSDLLAQLTPEDE